jgi:hypothetical protein
VNIWGVCGSMWFHGYKTDWLCDINAYDVNGGWVGQGAWVRVGERIAVNWAVFSTFIIYVSEKFVMFGEQSDTSLRILCGMGPLRLAAFIHIMCSRFQ